MINIDKIKESLSDLMLFRQNILDGKNLELLDSNDKQVKFKMGGYPIQSKKSIICFDITKN